jgi:hypothetical protein
VCRTSLRLQHGQAHTFPITLQRTLGEVRTVQLYWEYDHDVDPFDLGKLCPPFLCSDALYPARAVVSRVGYSGRRSLCLAWSLAASWC